MKSKILEKDREALIKLNRSMSPEERLMAFFHHSQLLAQLSLARGKKMKNSRTSKKIIRRNV